MGTKTSLSLSPLGRAVSFSFVQSCWDIHLTGWGSNFSQVGRSTETVSPAPKSHMCYLLLGNKWSSNAALGNKCHLKNSSNSWVGWGHSSLGWLGWSLWSAGESERNISSSWAHLLQTNFRVSRHVVLSGKSILILGCLCLPYLLFHSWKQHRQGDAPIDTKAGAKTIFIYKKACHTSNLIVKLIFLHCTPDATIL